MSFSGVSVVYPGAEPAGRHINKAGFIIHPGDIYRHIAADDRQLEGAGQVLRNTDAGGKVVSRAQR